MNFLRLAVIIGSLPNNIQNGQTADAIPLMADLNFIVNQVNANAAALSNTALLNAANSFTAVQSGVAATNPSNFPIAIQVQNFAFNTLSSIIGTNTISARVSVLPLGAYVSGQIFSFLPSQPNSSSVILNIDGVGPRSIIKQGSQDLVIGDLLTSTVAFVGVIDNHFLLLNENVLTNFEFSGTLHGAALLGSNITVPLSRMQRTEVSNKNSGAVSITGANTVTTVNLGTVNVGDRILCTATVHLFARGNADGQQLLQIVQSSGTATIVAGHDLGALETDFFSKAAVNMDITLSGTFKVTVGGTLTIALTASNDGNGTAGNIPDGNGQLYALVLNNG